MGNSNLNKPSTRKVNTLTEFVDVDTGEVISTEKQIVLSREPEFIKLYIDEVVKIYKLPKSNCDVLLVLFRHVNYENKIYLNSTLIKELSEELGIKTQSFRNSLSKLSKTDILHRVNTGVYLVNPKIAGRGKWKDIEKLRLKVSYLFSKEQGKVIEDIETEIL